MNIKNTKQEFLSELCKLLRMTTNLGAGNALKELRYVKDEENDEWAVPIFEDGTGEPCKAWPTGYYAVFITGDNNMGILSDVWNHFAKYY